MRFNKCVFSTSFICHNVSAFIFRNTFVDRRKTKNMNRTGRMARSLHTLETEQKVRLVCQWSHFCPKVLAIVWYWVYLSVNCTMVSSWFSDHVQVFCSQAVSTNKIPYQQIMQKQPSQNNILGYRWIFSSNAKYLWNGIPNKSPETSWQLQPDWNTKWLWHWHTYSRNGRKLFKLWFCSICKVDAILSNFTNNLSL